jgi:NAD(P)H-hydrate epimerase
MATGGSGDVLTGLIAALACQGLAPYEAARLGVYLHGLSGDLAAEELGQVSMIASDLVRYLPQALQTIS